MATTCKTDGHPIIPLWMMMMIPTTEHESHYTRWVYIVQITNVIFKRKMFVERFRSMLK